MVVLVPGTDNNCVILIGFDSNGEPKEYEPIRDTTDLAGAISPIIDVWLNFLLLFFIIYFQEYKTFYAKFRQENPDFKSDNEEPDAEEADEKTFEDKKREIREAIAKKRAAKEEQ